MIQTNNINKISLQINYLAILMSSNLRQAENNYILHKQIIN